MKSVNFVKKKSVNFVKKNTHLVIISIVCEVNCKEGFIMYCCKQNKWYP